MLRVRMVQLFTLGETEVVMLSNRLENGSRVGVIGGGPAGSFFALFLLKYARAKGVDLEVDIYEWRSFSDPGPKGCNRCAGILSASLLKNLKELDLVVPEEVIRVHISSYYLHSPFGVIHVDNPDPGAEILSVFRGGGPWHNPGEKMASFDGFLIEQARSQGASVQARRVQQVRVFPRPGVVLDDGIRPYDLLVLASGLNSGSVEVKGPLYSPATTLTMSQDELYVRKEDIQEYFGTGVRVFLIPHSDLVFGTLVPKGNFINVSLLGKGGPPDLEGFLDHDIVRRAMPFPYQRSCGCRPRIAVGMASRYYTDGFVAVGDAAVSRLYKDGIGSAFLTARKAAQVALYHGVSRGDFHKHYAPFTRALHHDNLLGHLLFALHHRTKDSSPFFRAHSRLIDSERSLSAPAQVFSRVLWGMFTGSYTYREIWGMVADAGAIARLAQEYVKEKLT
ncbi:MAG: hypothetical protein AB1603_00185 [Chloroflexota bacterium]